MARRNRDGCRFPCGRVTAAFRRTRRELSKVCVSYLFRRKASRLSLHRQHRLQRPGQPCAVFLCHLDKFNPHASRRRHSPHNSARPHFSEWQIQQHFHHAANRHWLPRRHKQSSQGHTFKIGNRATCSRLPCHPQTPRRHNAWIAPVLCIPHDQLPHPTMPEPLSLRQRKTPVNVLFRVLRLCMDCTPRNHTADRWKRPKGSLSFYLPKDVRRNSAPKSTLIPNENEFSRKGTLRL